MKKFLVLVALATMFLAVSCGGDSKNKESSNNNEIHDSDGVVETNNDPEYPEEEEPGGGGGSCSSKTSYGSTSFLRNEDFFDKCVYETEHSYDCYYPVSVSELFSNLQKLTIVFNKECYQQPYGSVSCPDFIPDSINFYQFTGCDIFHISGEFDCLADCPRFYFSTNSEIFKRVSFQHSGYYPSAERPFYSNALFSSENEELGLAFFITYDETPYDGASFYDRKSGEKYPVTLSFNILFDEMPDEEEEKSEEE